MDLHKIVGAVSVAVGLALVVSATSGVAMATVTNTKCTPAYVTPPPGGGSCTPNDTTKTCTSVGCTGQRSGNAVPGNCNTPETGTNCTMGTGVLNVATSNYTCGAYPGCPCNGFVFQTTPVQVANCS